MLRELGFGKPRKAAASPVPEKSETVVNPVTAGQPKTEAAASPITPVAQKTEAAGSQPAPVARSTEVPTSAQNGMNPKAA